MTSIAKLQKLFDFIKAKIEGEDNKKYYVEPKFFARERVLTWSKTVYLILSLQKQSLSSSLFNLLETNNLVSVSKSAFSQARYKIKSGFFKHLNKEMLHYLYNSSCGNWFCSKKFHGLNLIAVDGTRLRLPQKNDLKTYFGSQIGGSEDTPSESVMANCLIHYDILNELVQYINCAPLQTSEKSLLKESFAEVKCKNNLYIFDRGFSSSALFAYFSKINTKFVARLRLNFNNITKEFLASDATDKEVDFVVSKDENFVGTEGEVSLQAGTRVKVRLVKVLLSTGETEILATNLFSKTFNVHDFSSLYSKRWGVETGINSLKNQLLCMIFSGVKQEAIYQELYSTAMVYNIRQCFLYISAQYLPYEEGKKIPKLNKNVALGVILPRLMKCFFAVSAKKLFIEIKDFIIKNKIYEKKENQNLPEIKTERKKKLTQKRNLYTQTNFKRAI